MQMPRGVAWAGRTAVICAALVVVVVAMAQSESAANASGLRAGIANTLLVLSPPDGRNFYVCASGVDTNAATAVCRQLGYPADVTGVVSAGWSNGWQLRGRQYYKIEPLPGLACPPGATSLAPCRLVSPSTTDACSRFELASIQCLSNDLRNVTFNTHVVTWATPGATADLIGRVQVRPTDAADDTQWGSVCMSDATRVDATTALAFCRAAGFEDTVYASTILQLENQHHTGSHGATWVSDVECSPSLALPTAVVPLTNWQQCAFNAPVARCDRNPVAVDCDAWRMEARLLLPNGTALPSAGPTKNATLFGLLQVRPNATAAWGTVCGDSVEEIVAIRACVMLGWPANKTAAQVHRASSAVWSQFPAKWGPDGDAHIYMRRFLCTGSDTILSQCARWRSSPHLPCYSGNHLFLTCSVATEENFTPEWIVALIIAVACVAALAVILVPAAMSVAWLLSSPRVPAPDPSAGDTVVEVEGRVVTGEAMAALPNVPVVTANLERAAAAASSNGVGATMEPELEMGRVVQGTVVAELGAVVDASGGNGGARRSGDAASTL